MRMHIIEYIKTLEPLSLIGTLRHLIIINMLIFRKR